MADRIILHSDLNCFYASVEVNENPKLRDQAIAVCGSTEERHGIVLTASYPAKRRGVKTGMANWQAVRACPGLICVPPHYELYVKYSRLVRNIYLRYTDKMEPYGMDECWLDVSGSRQLHGDGTAIAEEIRKAVRDELGLTVSIGVSFNKIFAKLGSDMKKPDAVTTLPRDDWKGRVWPLPVSELLYVGPATTRKLMSRNILTIAAPFPDAALRTEEQRDVDVRPEVQTVDPPVIDAPKGTHFPVDLPVREAEVNEPAQLTPAQAFVEIRIHGQPIVVKQILGHRLDDRYLHSPDAVRRRVRLWGQAIGAILHVWLCVHMHIFPFADRRRVLDPFGVLVFFQIHFPPYLLSLRQQLSALFFALPPDLCKTNFTAFSYGYFTTCEHMFAIHDPAYCKL